MPVATAIAAASWDARQYLGFPDIEGGAPADIVAFASDLRSDPEALTRPVAIILAGRIVV